jgi:predicted phage gp36 major capsid-like protein
MTNREVRELLDRIARGTTTQADAEALRKHLNLQPCGHSQRAIVTAGDGRTNWCAECAREAAGSALI